MNEIRKVEKSNEAEGRHREMVPGLPIPAEWGFGASFRGPSYVTSFNTDDQSQKKILIQILNEEVLRPEMLVNTVLHVVHVTSEPREHVDDETGEQVRWIRTILTLNDGRHVEFNSNGILRSLKYLIQLEGMPPWNPALAMRLARKQYRNGHSGYVLAPVSAESSQEEEDLQSGKLKQERGRK